MGLVKRPKALPAMSHEYDAAADASMMGQEGHHLIIRLDMTPTPCLEGI
jgi:hypothetical protein